jgi:hypothetical protein
MQGSSQAAICGERRPSEVAVLGKVGLYDIAVYVVFHAKRISKGSKHTLDLVKR